MPLRGTGSASRPIRVTIPVPGTAPKTASPSCRYGEPKEGEAQRATPGSQDAGTAALRLQAFLFVLACGQQWALPRGVLPLAERLVHRFLLSARLIPPEVCPGAVPPARGVHKNTRTAARTACLRVRVYVFLQSFPVHSSHPRCRRLTGLELSKKR